MTNKSKNTARWFRFFAWIGILGNFAFAIPAVFFPAILLEMLRLDPVEDPVWLGDAGLLLTFLSLMYVGAAIDPQRYRLNTWLMVIGRLAFVPYWFWPRGPEASMTGFLPLGIGDLVIGIVQTVLLVRFWRASGNGL